MIFNGWRLVNKSVVRQYFAGFVGNLPNACSITLQFCESFEISDYFSESLHNPIRNFRIMVFADDYSLDIRENPVAQRNNDNGWSINNRFFAFGWRDIFKRCIWICCKPFREENITIFDWCANDCKLATHMVCSESILFICISSNGRIRFRGGLHADSNVDHRNGGW